MPGWRLVCDVPNSIREILISKVKPRLRPSDSSQCSFTLRGTGWGSLGVWLGCLSVDAMYSTHYSLGGDPEAQKCWKGNKTQLAWEQCWTSQEDVEEVAREWSDKMLDGRNVLLESTFWFSSVHVVRCIQKSPPWFLNPRLILNHGQFGKRVVLVASLYPVELSTSLSRMMEDIFSKPTIWRESFLSSPQHRKWIEFRATVHLCLSLSVWIGRRRSREVKAGDGEPRWGKREVGGWGEEGKQRCFECISHLRFTVKLCFTVWVTVPLERRWRGRDERHQHLNGAESLYSWNFRVSKKQMKRQMKYLV